MELVGDYLVVADPYATYQLVVMDTRTGETRGAFGRKGDGPKEIRVPNQLFVESVTPPRLWVWDPRNLRFTLWDIDRPGPLLEPLQSFRVEARGAFQSAFLIANGMIFTSSYNENALLYLADSAGVVRRTVGELPYPVTWDQNVNYPFPLADPARRRVALLFLCTNRVDFYEVTGRHIATGAAPVDVPPLRLKRVGGELQFERPIPRTFGAGSATSRFVYASYCSGCTMAGRSNDFRFVHVFDWTGEFVMTLDLGAPIWAIEADDNDEVLYVAIVNPFPLIVKYRLPQALRDWGRP